MIEPYLNIAGRKIGYNFKPLVVPEMGVNHGGSLEVAFKIVDEAKKCGALGGKLLGAGKTGYLLIYASPLYQKSIKDSLAKKGVIQELFKFDKNGLEVWSTKR